MHNTSSEALQQALQASLADGDDNDDELAAAIAASLSGVSAPAQAPSVGDAEERAMALSRALSEPEPADGVTLQVRLKDGSILRRSFRADAPLDVVFDFVIGSSSAANANGVLREGAVRFSRSQKTIAETFGNSKRVALVFE